MARTRVPKRSKKSLNVAHIDLVQTNIAMRAISASTLRNQGAPGMVSKARTYLARLDLNKFRVRSAAAFRALLDGQTTELANAFPANGQGNWGAARKALNIFLRDVVESRSLCEQYQLQDIEPWLEVPLDADVARPLCYGWPGVRHLTPEISDEYQVLASILTEMLGYSRVALDLYLWRADQNKTLQNNQV